MSTRANVWKSTRSVRLIDQGFKAVPTLLKDNIRLFNSLKPLEPNEDGLLYMKEDAFYNAKYSPEYAMAVDDGIYQQMMTEVTDSKTLPWGLYFCCHGGDGAHTGVAHDDYVDIKVAWTILSILFWVMMFLVFVMPWPDNEIDDDFFGH